MVRVTRVLRISLRRISLRRITLRRESGTRRRTSRMLRESRMHYNLTGTVRAHFHR